MGLLDDAIREHMELKRLRGADPSEVARQEQDVLGAVPRRGDGETQTPDGGELDTAEGSDGHDQLAGGQRADADDDSTEHPHPAHGADFANVGQETAELDMRTVLDEHHEADDPARRTGGAEAEGTAPEGAPDDDGEPVDDVLEETPDFLRDTPEQERLWFEQQPPRDFDFDK
jgi:hypothetical protein